MSFFPEDRVAELRGLFFESARELLQTLNEQGLDLEKSPGNPEVIRGIRRTVHTLKGDSAACGFRELSEVAHELEDLLQPEVAAASGNSLAQLVLSAADMFDEMLAAYRGNLQPPNSDSFREMMTQLAAQPTPATEIVGFSPEFNWSEYDHLLISSALRDGGNVYNVALELDSSSPMRAAAVQVVLKTLSELGDVIARHPEEIPSEGLEKIEVALSTKLDSSDLKQKCRIPSVVRQVVLESCTEDVTTSVYVAPSLNTTSLSSKFSPIENTLRVDAERVDAVMNLVGELIIGKSMLQQAVNEFGKRFPKDPLKTRFSDALSKQSQVLHTLQRSVMKVRMVPVEQLFRRFPRVLRDAARTCGKDVELLTSGLDTDLDKGILDQLAEPLTHLVRNAIDHGIESSNERISLGKSPRGAVRLSAYHQANHVVVEVSDDGRGMDPNKLAAKAIEKGLRKPEDVVRMSEHEKLELIFESGLSTSEQVTTMSGRGVGMDVVRAVITRLKGTVQIINTPGQGTTFRLTMPLTLAIIRALLFAVGSQCYAVPLNSVVEITRAAPEEIHNVENCEVLHLRNETITLARLGRLVSQAPELPGRKMFVVVISLADRKFGLVVDRLVGEEELVIKAMDDQLVATDLVSGASILGDGSVVLILNLPVFIERVALSGGRRSTGTKPSTHEVVTV